MESGTPLNDDLIQHTKLAWQRPVPIPQGYAVIDILPEQTGQVAAKGFHQRGSFA